MRILPLTRAVLLLGGVFSFALVSGAGRPTHAIAQDGEDEKGGKEGGDKEEGGEPPQEGPPDGAPVVPVTMEGAQEVSDGKKVFTLKLPKDWKSVPNESVDKNILAVFEGPYTSRDGGRVVLSVAPMFARASLAFGVDLGAKGALTEGRTRKGAGFLEGCVVQAPGRRALMHTVRYIEKDGVVYAATALANVLSKDRAWDLTQKILDTVKVTGKAVPLPVPAGFATKKASIYDYATDADKSSDGLVARTIALCDDPREVLIKALKGKPFDETRPMVRPYVEGAKFVEDTKSAFGDAPKIAAFDAESRIVFITTYKNTSDEYEGAVRMAAAQQYVWQYFGGVTPAFLNFGLAAYATAATQAGGKPEKMRGDQIKKLKANIGGKIKLDEWMTMTGLPDAEKSADELMAWHWFFRHGVGKKWKKQYEGYIDAMRTTGDTAAAKKAWDGVDFDALQKEFGDFVLRWE